MERETGFEPATSTLARSHSTAELLPLRRFVHYIQRLSQRQCYGQAANGGTGALARAGREHQA